MSEYYVEWDNDVEMFCVFHSEYGDFAFASYCNESEAKEHANNLNGNQVN